MTPVTSNVEPIALTKSPSIHAFKNSFAVLETTNLRWRPYYIVTDEQLSSTKGKCFSTGYTRDPAELLKSYVVKRSSYFLLL